MESALLQLAEETAARNRLTLAVEKLSQHPPAPLNERVITAVEAAADDLGLSHTRLPSFAGHDTQVLSAITPSAMFFVPSVGGISHHPRELTHPQDIINGANTLLGGVLKFM